MQHSIGIDNLINGKLICGKEYYGLFLSGYMILIIAGLMLIRNRYIVFTGALITPFLIMLVARFLNLYTGGIFFTCIGYGMVMFLTDKCVNNIWH